MVNPFMQLAIELSLENVRTGRGGPFGAVIVRGEEVIASAANRVTLDLDPTAHAEVVAIRKACEAIGQFQIPGCDLYTSCEPCPMCMAAAYWARVDRVFYANSREDAAEAGFGDAHIYEELARPLGERRIPMGQIMRDEGLAAFRLWAASDLKIEY